MRIIETDINDIQDTINPTEEKISLSEEIINYIQPIFSKEYNDRVKEIKGLKESLDKKRETIKTKKNNLESLFKDYSKKDKESKLLKKMGKLVGSGLIQESMKNEMIVLLKSFENMPEEKITSYLNETIRVLGQKFAKS